MEELLEDIEKLVEEELERANAVNQQFHGTHEGYAILKEEIEESDIENAKVNKILDNLWHSIRFDYKNEKLIPICRSLKKHALFNAAESIQVAAMSDKLINYLEVK